MARLELQQVCKGFDRPILDRLSLTVEEGEFFVIVGPSGIGGRTLFPPMAGFSRSLTESAASRISSAGRRRRDCRASNRL